MVRHPGVQHRILQGKPFAVLPATLRAQGLPRQRTCKPCCRLLKSSKLDQSVSVVQVMAASSHKQRVQRAFVRIALTTAQHGFTALDRSLVYFSALMTDAYDVWYESWAKVVQVTLLCCCFIRLTVPLLSWLL